MQSAVLGIDVSKDRLDVCLLVSEDRHSEQFDNTTSGCKSLRQWINGHRISHVHACLEATGTYGDRVALDLHQAGHQVSVVNPVRIKGFALSRDLARTKTDKIDAGVIAAFCRALNPVAWTPPPPERLALRAMVRRLQTLKTVKQQEHNRLSSGELCPIVRDSINQHIAFIEQQLDALQRAILAHIRQHPCLRADFDLLKSIKGIGDQTACVLLAEILDIHQFNTAKQLVAYAGLHPALNASGKRQRSHTPISKKGNGRLRAGLYMAGICAKKHNPPVRALRERLEARGKAKKEVTVAAMAKLLRIVYGVLTSRRPFDPNFVQFQAQTP